MYFVVDQTDQLTSYDIKQTRRAICEFSHADTIISSDMRAQSLPEIGCRNWNDFRQTVVSQVPYPHTAIVVRRGKILIRIKEVN